MKTQACSDEKLKKATGNFLKINRRRNTVIFKIKNYNELITNWNSCHGRSSEFRDDVETRMFQLNDTCSDYDELMERWAHSENDSVPQKQIEARIVTIGKKRLSFATKNF